MKFLVLLIVLCGCSQGARWKLSEENDYFTLFNKDSDYTQGLVLSRETDSDEWAAGQRIYTPRHKKINPPDPKERPYSGLVFFRRMWSEPAGDARILRYGFDAGLVGPSAHGKEVQCGVHELLGQSCPLGWGHQLPDEPGGNARAELIDLSQFSILGLYARREDSVLLQVGTFNTDLRVESTVTGEAHGLHIFAGPAFTVVFRDITLDGSTWEDSPSVEKEMFVSELRGGFGFTVMGLKTTWEIVVKTPQYKGQGSYNYGKLIFEW